MEIVLTLENANAVLATRTVLLVDDEENILSALKRLLQRDGYRILTAGGGLEGLAMLASEPVDVIISDRRIPQMAGVEFLRQVKPLYPDTVHMVLSGYTELQSITNDINEGAIYRFLTKPWDDDLLRGHIVDASRSKEMVVEHKRLSQELALANEQLRELLAERERQLQRDEVVLSVAQEILQLLPLPNVGVDADGLIVAANAEADVLFGGGLSPCLAALPKSACRRRWLPGWRICRLTWFGRKTDRPAAFALRGGFRPARRAG